MESQVVSHQVAPDTEALSAYGQVGWYGILPVNAFIIRGQQPVLVDTGIVAMGDEFMRALHATIAPEELRWLWLTHTDPDHMGSLRQILAEAPDLQLVTTFLGLGKLGLHGITPERPYLVNPGETLDIGDRQLVCIKPPSYDAPETTAFYDTKTGVLFSADSFGALMQQPAERAEAMDPAALREGMVTWATVDAPWFAISDEGRLNDSFDAVRRLNPQIVLSSHLPPAAGITDRLLEYLAIARTTAPFAGPDQATLIKMMSGGGTA